MNISGLDNPPVDGVEWRLQSKSNIIVYRIKIQGVDGEETRIGVREDVGVLEGTKPDGSIGDVKLIYCRIWLRILRVRLTRLTPSILRQSISRDIRQTQIQDLRRPLLSNGPLQTGSRIKPLSRSWASR